MAKIDSYEKLNEPGIWFVCSEKPANQLSRYIYDLAFELGLPIVVYSSSTKKEIQNEVQFSASLKPNVLRLRQTN